MGRVQLVNSVINSMLLYSFHVYPWPANLLKQLTKMIKTFIWSGDITQAKICTVAWRDLCKPNEEGSLSVKDPRLVNSSSLLQLCWSLVTSDEQWTQMCRTRYLKNGKPITYNRASSVWSGMRVHLRMIAEQSSWSIGNGNTVNFWTDKWLEQSIVESLNIPLHMHPALNMKVADYILDGNWNIPMYLIQKSKELAKQILTVTLSIDDSHDRLNWRASVDGKLTSKIAPITPCASLVLR